MLTEIVAKIRSRSFENTFQLAQHYDRTRNFASVIKRVVIERGILSEDEWSAGFTKRFQRLNVHSCAKCGHVGTPIVTPRMKLSA